MGLEKTEDQNLFNAEKTAKKNYKTCGRTSHFFGGSGAAVAIGVGVRASGSTQRTPLPPKKSEVLPHVL